MRPGESSHSFLRCPDIAPVQACYHRGGTSCLIVTSLGRVLLPGEGEPVTGNALLGSHLMTVNFTGHLASSFLCARHPSPEVAFEGLS